MKRTTKIFLRTFARLSFKKMVKLIMVWLPNPLLSVMAAYATVKSFTITKKYFPKTHSSNGIGNAFRHALWCCLIMMYGCKISSPQKTLRFCKRITDFHEELFPNEPLETKMDLHNNAIGIDLFLELLQGIHRQFFETTFFIDQLLNKVKTAKIIEHVEQEFPGELIYLKEDK